VRRHDQAGIREITRSPRQRQEANAEGFFSFQKKPEK
jgi:hypothetical protein